MPLDWKSVYSKCKALDVHEGHQVVLFLFTNVHPGAWSSSLHPLPLSRGRSPWWQLPFLMPLSPPAPLAEHTRSPSAFRGVKGKQFPCSQFWIQSQSLHFLEPTELFAAPWPRMFLEAVLKGEGLLLERIFQG